MPRRLALFVLAVLSPAALAQDLRAGAAAVDITPALEPGHPVYMAGFYQDRIASAVHDPIWARALVLESGGEHYAFVALDLIGHLSHRIESATARIEAELSIPGDHVVVASTHTHDGPDAIGIWGPRLTKCGIDLEWLDRVDAAIVESVRRAAAALAPARLRFGEVEVPEVLRDTRAPVVTDPVLRTLHLASPGGDTIATVCVYAMHPEALGSDNTEISSDYPHFLRARCESVLGGTTIFFSGAVGGMQTPEVPANDFESCRKVGETLADRGLASIAGAAWVQAPAIRMVTRRISFPMVNPRFRAATALGIIPGQRFLEYEGRGLLKKPRVPCQTSVLAIGPVRIATLPGELFPEIAPAIRDSMRSGPKVLIGLAGNEIGYIIPSDAWDDSKYEESMSLGPETGPLLVDALRDMLTELEADLTRPR